MKKPLLKLFLSLITIVFFSMKTNAQYKLYPEIESGLATDRIKNYTAFKEEALDELLDDGYKEGTMITVGKPNFYNMVSDFQGRGFDGFRVYFAQITNNLSNPHKIPEIKGGLTLAFVPTKYDAVKKREMNQDDYFYYCTHTGKNGEAVLTRAITSQLAALKTEIKRYQTTRLPALERAAAEHEELDLTDFVETKSIWYEIKVLDYKNGEIVGLYQYLKDDTTGQKVDYINIKFAARKMQEQFEHHLDIVTELHYKGGETSFVGWSTEDIKNFSLNELKDLYFDESIKSLPENLKPNCLSPDKKRVIASNIEEIKNFSLLGSIDSLGELTNKLKETFRSLRCLHEKEKDTIDLKIDQFTRVVTIMAETYVDTGNPCPTRTCQPR